jgi:hypothetical protein
MGKQFQQRTSEAANTGVIAVVLRGRLLFPSRQRDQQNSH